MREIVFRAKELHTGEWVYGWYLKTFFGGPGLSHAILDRYEAALNMVHCHEIDESTLGQYTGVNDMHKVGIFEGDIVRVITGRVCKVEWFSSLQYVGWDLVPIGNLNCPPPKKEDLWRCEVIGNIHDYPNYKEMLELQNQPRR